MIGFACLLCLALHVNQRYYSISWTCKKKEEGKKEIGLQTEWLLVLYVQRALHITNAEHKCGQISIKFCSDQTRTKGFSSFPLHTELQTRIHTWAIFSFSALGASGAWVSRTGSSSGEIWSSLVNVWSQICRIKETSLQGGLKLLTVLHAAHSQNDCRIREMLIGDWSAVHRAVLFISRLRFALWPSSCIRLRVGPGELCDITQRQSELSGFLNRIFINVLTFSAPSQSLMTPCSMGYFKDRMCLLLWASCPTKVSFTPRHPPHTQSQMFSHIHQVFVPNSYDAAPGFRKFPRWMGIQPGAPPQCRNRPLWSRSCYRSPQPFLKPSGATWTKTCTSFCQCVYVAPVGVSYLERCPVSGCFVIRLLSELFSLLKWILWLI